MSTTATPPTTRRWLAVLAIAACCASSCAQEGPYSPPNTTMRVPDSPLLSGVVSADGRTDVAVDIGAARPVSVTLAEVTAADCNPTAPTALSTALARFLPVGTPVVLVRSGLQPQPEDAISAFVHVRPANSNGAIAPAGPSVNELVLAAGLARLNPGVNRAATADPVDAQVATAAAKLPVPDRTYLSGLAAAESDAWHKGAGVLPDCIARQHDLDSVRAPATTPATPAAPSTPVDVRRTDIRIDIQIHRPVRPKPLCRWTSRC